MTQQLTVSRRRIHEVQEWIDAENFPKALSTCTKWFKKGERSSAFLAKRALVLAMQKDETSRQRGKDETIKLCDRDPPLTSVDELLDLEKSIESLDIGNEYSQKAWDRAAKANPQNSELQETRVHHCMDREDWKGAQQAAMTLRKNFPTARKYEFWSTFTSYLIAKDDPTNGLFGQLAYRMIKSLADQTPKTVPEDELLPGKYIAYPDELLLLLYICKHLRKFEEIVDILESENLGVRSGIVIQEINTFSLFYAETLKELGRWDKIAVNSLGVLRAVYSRAEAGQQIPQGLHVIETVILLAEAVRKAEDQNIDEELHTLLADALQKAPNNLTFRYAQVVVAAIDIEKGVQSPETLLELCKSFYEQFPTWFHLRDLTKDIVDSLGRELARELASFACFLAIPRFDTPSDPLWHAWTRNALELKYCFNISQSSDPVLISAFVCKCLKAYGQACQKSDLDDHDHSSATVPAVMSLLRMSESPVNNRISTQVHGPSLFQACLILFHAVEKYPQGEEPCVLLILYASMLGLAPLALYAFQILSIKNMQFDNFAHYMFTRISTLHPHDVSDHPQEKEFHPRSFLQGAIAQYKAYDKTFSAQVMTGMNLGTYVNAESAILERGREANSLCKRFYILEKRRIERLLGMASGYDKLDVTGGMIDSRSSEGIPNLELNGHAPFEVHLRYAPYPRVAWASVMTLQDWALHILYRMSQFSAQKSAPSTFDFPEQMKDLNELVDYPDECRGEFTEVEHGVNQIIVTYVKAATILMWRNHMDDTTAQTYRPHFKNLVDVVEKWLDTKILDLSDPRRLGPLANTTTMNGRQLPANWLYFHWSYATLEAIQGLALFLKVAKAFNNPKVENGIYMAHKRWQRMREMTGEVVRRIHEHAKHLRSELNRPGFLDDMINMIFERHGPNTSEIGLQLEKVVDEDTMEKMLGLVKESWISGLEGIEKVKVVLP